VLTGLAAVLAFGAPASSQLARKAKDLPVCNPKSASTAPPAGPPKVTSARACRAGDKKVQKASGRKTREAGAAVGGRSAPGYTHLGAGTADEWAGVSGRIAVTDSAVRRNTYDFVASRFMAKQPRADGGVEWLEAGWAETGWSGAGRQRIYTFDTNTWSWRFHDQYVLRPGDRIWLDLRAGTDGSWNAWLWWDNRWNLLASERLPLGRTAQIEQYVELHVDPRKPARVTVPPVTVDNVRLLDDGDARMWRNDVDTLTDDDEPQGRGAGGGLCLNWITRYDTWSAGNC
jgi:hypothetical protein